MSLGHKGYHELRRRIQRMLPPQQDVESSIEEVQRAVDSGSLDDLVAVPAVPDWIALIDEKLVEVRSTSLRARLDLAYTVLALQRQVVRLIGGTYALASDALIASVDFSLANAFHEIDMKLAARYYKEAATKYFQVDDAWNGAVCQMNSAVCIQYLGRARDALPMFEAAERILEQDRDQSEHAYCLMNHAGCLHELGRMTEALHFYRRAVEAMPQDGDPAMLANCQSNYAGCLLDAGNVEEARHMFARAEPVLREIGTPVDFARCEVDYASCLWRAGNHADALQRYEEAEQVLRDHGTWVDHERCRINWAILLQEAERADEAQALYESVIEECSRIGPPSDETAWRAKYNLALLLMKADPRSFPARQLLHEALELVESLAASARTLPNRIGLRETYADVYRWAVVMDLTDGNWPAAFDHAQRAKGRGLIDVTQHRARRPSVLRHRLDEGIPEVSRIMLHSSEPASSEPPEGVGSSEVPHDTGMELPFEQLEQDQEGAFVALGAVNSLDEIRSVLHPEEAILDYLDIGHDVAAFVVTRSGLAHAALLRGKTITPIVRRFRDAWRRSLGLLRQGTLREIAELGELYDSFIRPLEETGALTKSSRLFISPSGRLHSIPFAALVDTTTQQSAHYLSETRELCTVPTATSLCFLRTGQEQHFGPVTLIAAAPFATDPVPGDPRKGEFRGTGQLRDISEGAHMLPYTGWEAVEIGKLVEAATPQTRAEVLLGTRASLQTVEAHARNHNIVVISTHGAKVRQESGLLDYSLLFQAESEGNEYELLSMRALYDGEFSLHGVFQIGLTACHLGSVAQHGEEAMGFSQAFLSAGASVVLAPLWAVDDRATAVLSVTYHAALVSAGRPSVCRAMQLAMKQIRESPKWQHPFYWSAILPAGDGALSLG